MIKQKDNDNYLKEWQLYLEEELKKALVKSFEENNWDIDTVDIDSIVAGVLKSKQPVKADWKIIASGKVETQTPVYHDPYCPSDKLVGDKFLLDLFEDYENKNIEIAVRVKEE